MAPEIEVGNCGVVDLDPEESSGETYGYVVWKSLPYLPEGNKDHHRNYVADGVFLDYVPNTERKWVCQLYTEVFTIHIRHVIFPNVDLPKRVVGGSPDFPDTRGVPRYAAKFRKARLIEDEIYNKIHDEMARRCPLDYAMDTDAEDAESDDDSGDDEFYGDED